MRRPGLGLKGSALGTVQPPLSRANTRSALPSPPRAPSPFPGAGGLRAPATSALVRAPAPRLRAGNSGFPGSQAARLPGEGRREWRREDGEADARQQPARLSGSARAALPLPGPARLCGHSGCGGGRAGAGCGGGHRRELWGLPVTPLPVARGTQQPGTRWPKEQNRGL